MPSSRRGCGAGRWVQHLPSDSQKPSQDRASNPAQRLGTVRETRELVKPFPLSLPFSVSSLIRACVCIPATAFSLQTQRRSRIPEANSLASVSHEISPKGSQAAEYFKYLCQLPTTRAVCPCPLPCLWPCRTGTAPLKFFLVFRKDCGGFPGLALGQEGKKILKRKGRGEKKV